MSQFISVYCKDGRELTRREIVDNVSLQWMGEGDPTFVPPESDRASELTDWSELIVTLPGSGRPITVRRDIDPVTIAEFVAEIEQESESIPESVREPLRNSGLVFSIEIFPDAIDDDAWEFLDQLELFLARTCNGLIVADDGVYGSDLQLLVEI